MYLASVRTEFNASLVHVFVFVFFFLGVFPSIPKLVLFLSFVRFCETRISSTIMRIFKLVATCSRKPLFSSEVVIYCTSINLT